MFHKFIYLLGKKYLYYSFLVFVLLILTALLEIIGIGLIPLFISYLFDPDILIKNISNNLDYDFIHNFLSYIKDINLIYLGSLTIFSIFLIKNLIILLSTFVETKLVSKVKSNNSKKLLQYYLYLPIIYHLKKNPSQLIRNIQIGVSNSSEFIIIFIKIFKETVVLLFLLILLLFTDYKVTLACLFVFTFTLFIYLKFIKKDLEKRGAKQNLFKSNEIKILRQTLSSLKETKVYGIKDKFISQFKDNISLQLKNVIFFRVVQSIPRLLLEQVTISVILLITVYLFIVTKDKSTVLPVLTLFTLSSLRMIPGLNSIALSIASYKFRKASFDIIYDEFKRIDKIKVDTNSNQKISFKNKIYLSEISYFYNNKKKILNKLNLGINKNKMTSIIGKSGAGKTTLLNIILGLIKPKSGKIYIDNKEVNLNNTNWQKLIGYVPQDVYLLDDSIRRNIIFGRKCETKDEKKIDKILKLLNLNEVVDRLNNELSNTVGDKGSRLSGGEKQRVGIARALYSSPEILVLDEATSSLDNDLEEQIIKNIKEKFSKCTILSISHRKIPLKYSDNIFIMKNSKLKKIRNSINY